MIVRAAGCGDTYLSQVCLFGWMADHADTDIHFEPVPRVA